MSAFAYPLLWALILIPLLGAALIGALVRLYTKGEGNSVVSAGMTGRMDSRLRGNDGGGEVHELARRITFGVTVLCFLVVLRVAYEFFAAEAPVLFEPFDIALWLRGSPFLQTDELSVILLLFTSFTFAIVSLIFPKTELRAASFVRLLVAEAMTLGSFCTQEPSVLALFWILSILITIRELQARGEAARSALVLFRRYMGLSALCFAGGAALFTLSTNTTAQTIAATLFMIAFLLRKGIVPFHSWMPEFFARASLGLVILFSVPQLGSYAIIRLVIPVEANNVLLGFIGVASLFTAVYGAGIALVQTEARRAYGFLFMSQSALVLTGIESLSEIGLAGSIALWVSGGLALTGFGLTIWLLEARRGPVSLHRFHGWYERMPALAASFLLLGLASVGFPGTFGFIGGELLVDGALGAFVYIGFAVVVATALNGINVLRMYFLIFCGGEVQGATSLQRLKVRESLGFFLLVFALIFGGLFPKTFVASIGRAVGHVLQITPE